MAIMRTVINLNEPYRANSANHLQLKDKTWTAIGHDPYIVYNLDDHRFVGPWMLDLVVDGVTGMFRPRVYVHQRNGFNESAAQYMRQVDSNHYTLALLAPRRCQMIRLDPAESDDCSFQVTTFTARPMSVGSFFARALRNGEDRAFTIEHRIECLKRVAADLRRRRVSFEFANLQSESQRDWSYPAWIRKFEAPSASPTMIAERCRSLEAVPLVSVLMPVYDTPQDILDAAIRSVVEQIYPNWELCIADDASSEPWIRPTLERWQQADSRIKVAFRSENGHISEATNTAFSMASGDWIALLDHDDMLARHALAEIACTINAHPDAEIIYSDEDKRDEAGRRYMPFFKPDWSYDLFTGQNYLNHLTVHRAVNIRGVGGWRRGFEGSQDYDLNLRIIETIDQARIVHVPKVLYHWSAARGSVAAHWHTKTYAYDAGHRALLEHAARMNLDATVVPVGENQYYRLKRAIPKEPALISLIIPTRDKADILKVCVDSILGKTDYPRYEIIIVDNNSVEEATFAYFSSLADHKNIRVLRYEQPFNFSAINNFAVRRANGELVGLVNNDIEVISEGWLSEMASHALRPEIGCVGAKLYYPNDTVQHAGVILGLGGVAGHSHKYARRASGGYIGRLMVVQNLSAVTAACMLVRKEVYLAAGGFDEENLSVAFNDVDFCLRVRQLGYLNLWTPFAELYHHESISRGSDSVPGAAERFQKEIFYMKDRWRNELRADPYYSEHLTKDREDFSLTT